MILASLVGLPLVGLAALLWLPKGARVSASIRRAVPGFIWGLTAVAALSLGALLWVNPSSVGDPIPGRTPVIQLPGLQFPRLNLSDPGSSGESTPALGWKFDLIGEPGPLVALGVMLCLGSLTLLSIPTNSRRRHDPAPGLPRLVGEDSGSSADWRSLGAMVILGGLVLSGIASEILVIALGAHLVTLGVALWNLPDGDDSTPIQERFISLQRWLLHQLPGDLSLLATGVMLWSGLGFTTFPQIASLLEPTTFQQGLLEIAMIVWFLGCLPKLSLFPTVLAATAWERQPPLRKAFSLAFGGSAAGLWLLARHWPLVTHTGVGSASAAVQLALQVAVISAVACGWMFLAEQTAARSSGPDSSGPVSSLPDSFRPVSSQPAMSLLFATLISLSAWLFFAGFSNSPDNSPSNQEPLMFAVAPWLLGIALLVASGGRIRWSSGVALLGLALLPITIDPQSLTWMHGAVLLAIFLLAAGLPHLSRIQEWEGGAESGTNWLVLIPAMLLFLVFSLPGSLLRNWWLEGSLPLDPRLLIVPVVVLWGGMSSLVVGLVPTLGILLGRLLRPLIEMGREHFHLGTLLFWEINLPVRGLAQWVRFADWYLIDGSWQRVGTVAVQSGLWLRGLQTGQITLYALVLVLMAGLWTMLLVAR